MAVPFRRTSSSKKKMRHSVANLNFKKRAMRPLIKCKNCQQIKKPHLICLSCSSYHSIKYNT